MNKMFASVILGLVLSVFASAAMGNYCDDEKFGSGDTLRVCNYGDGYRLDLLKYPLDYNDICNPACDGIGYSGDGLLACMEGCIDAAKNNDPDAVTCINEGYGLGSGPANGCDAGRGFWAQKQDYQCRMLCHGDPGVMESVCVSACEWTGPSS